MRASSSGEYFTGRFSMISVFVSSGKMLQVRIPNFQASLLSETPKPIIPNLADWYAMPDTPDGFLAAVEMTLMIRPSFWARIGSNTAWNMLYCPVRLTRITLSQSSGVRFSIRRPVPATLSPALLTRMSTRPSSATRR